MSRMQDAVREVMDTLEAKANAQAISGTMTEHAIKDIVSEMDPNITTPSQAYGIMREIDNGDFREAARILRRSNRE
ncbi:hypothetical protein R9X47_24155 [Wukongibacter baidiensis]|uniref:hypothetical protein n=1 Tax=Wukongibacter baidiensis TaxID=1723361 RepID=UPI003D7F84E3